MADLSVKIGGLKLKNPVMTASGTFGYGLEFADFVPLEEIGGIIVKGTTLNPREGNDYPRMAETAQGMLNCVGLQNKGVDYFCRNIYPQIKDIDTNMIVNVSGSSPDDYAECAARINELDKIPAIELNISCPNVKQGGMAFGVTTTGAASVVRAVRERYNKPIIVKLSPNVTDVTEIAKAVEAEGADSVSLINTLMGMAIDIERRRPMLSINTGGLSGPADVPGRGFFTRTGNHGHPFLLLPGQGGQPQLLGGRTICAFRAECAEQCRSEAAGTGDFLPLRG